MSLRHEIVRRRLSVFGLSNNQITQIMTEVNSWVLYNGFEWTISRIKQMKISFIHQIAFPDKKTHWEWIKTRSNLPVGSFRPIFKLKNPKKILNALMIYSDFISPKVTQKQWKKFYGSAHQEIDDSEYKLFQPLSSDNSQPIGRFESTLGKDIIITYKYPHHLGHYVFSNEGIDYVRNRAPSWRSINGKSMNNDAKNVVDSFSHLFIRDYINKYYANTKMPDWFDLSIKQQWRRINDVRFALDHQDHVGRISFIQEPGYKLRAIANPFPAFQSMLKPLKSFVMNAIKVIPNDYCHDQEAGMRSIQHHLKENSDTLVSSIDLSDATNNIPLRPQIELMETLLGPSHPQLELFRKVAKGKWYVDSPDGESSMTFNVGHPLGTGPSFGLFSLFHHYVARSAICMVDGEPNAIDDFYKILCGIDLSHSRNVDTYIEKNNFETIYPYWIVGDDIVISNRYQDAYISIINGIYNVPISFDKCLFESRTAEFCSRIITSEKLIPLYKWKKVSDSNFIDIARNLGPKSMKLFRPKQQKILHKIAGIPDTLGGPISWNPLGKSLLEREAEFWKEANEYNSIKESTSPYIRRDEIHYQFLRDIGILLNFKKLSLFDVVNDPPKPVMVSDEYINVSRQREFLYNEFLFNVKRGAKVPHSFISAVMLLQATFPNIRMSEAEYNKLEDLYTFEPKSIDDNREYDVFFEKLYNHYFNDQSL
jgi:hypothetical protein